MDFGALWEALVAVGITPIVSIGMAVIVVGAIVFLYRRFTRR
jgi:hypothetical protein